MCLIFSSNREELSYSFIFFDYTHVTCDVDLERTRSSSISPDNSSSLLWIRIKLLQYISSDLSVV